VSALTGEVVAALVAQSGLDVPKEELSALIEAVEGQTRLLEPLLALPVGDIVSVPLFDPRGACNDEQHTAVDGLRR
jgi:hypothetical protein